MAADSSLDLHISVFVTCLCDPEALPSIPNLDITTVRPSVHTLLNNLLEPLLSGSSDTPSTDIEGNGNKLSVGSRSDRMRSDGGVAVCASGPETLTREARNAVARVGVKRSVELGGVALHTELFAL